MQFFFEFTRRSMFRCEVFFSLPLSSSFSLYSRVKQRMNHKMKSEIFENLPALRKNVNWAPKWMANYFVFFFVVLLAIPVSSNLFRSLFFSVQLRSLDFIRYLTESHSISQYYFLSVIRPKKINIILFITANGVRISHWLGSREFRLRRPTDYHYVSCRIGMWMGNVWATHTRTPNSTGVIIIVYYFVRVLSVAVRVSPSANQLCVFERRTERSKCSRADDADDTFFFAVASFKSADRRMFRFYFRLFASSEYLAVSSIQIKLT